MKTLLIFPLLSLFILPVDTIAQSYGTASGEGKIEVIQPDDPNGGPIPEPVFVAFRPTVSGAFENGGFTWLVLTEKKPNLSEWSSSSAPENAGRAWCEKEKASFVAIKLDKTLTVDLAFLCPGNGNLRMEMVSTINGLQSVQIGLVDHSGTKLKGTLQMGEGNCPDETGKDAYCTAKGSYTFETQQ